MKLDHRVRRLIAVGASVSANCQPCLQTNAREAIEEGLDRQEIAEAVEVGRMVRRGAASSTDTFAAGLERGVSPETAASLSSCECR